MSLLTDALALLRMSKAHNIARRYFVTNGFDGTLTMLGLTVGISATDTLGVTSVLNACLGAAIALAVSGFSSAYISELAERKRSLGQLQSAMLRDLDASDHGHAARLVPFYIGLVNGLSPLFMSIIIMTPLWLDIAGVPLPYSALHLSTGAAFTLVFLLGAYLGKVSGTFWGFSCARALIIALVTAGLIVLCRQG